MRRLPRELACPIRSHKCRLGLLARSFRAASEASARRISAPCMVSALSMSGSAGRRPKRLERVHGRDALPVDIHSMGPRAVKR